MNNRRKTRRAASEPDTSERELTILPPDEIVAKLDEYVIGQDHAKKVLAVAVYNHYKRLVNQMALQAGGEECPVEIQKSNVMLLGPTGSGKTHLARTLAKTLDVPFAIADATTLTEAGYVGEDVENVLLKLVQSADWDVGYAEYGIIYIDEIDKIGRTTSNVNITRDVSGEGVQQALLKIIEGTIANVPPQGGRKHPEQAYLQLDTSNILFIVGGAFVGLEDVIQKRLGTEMIGFDRSAQEPTSQDATPLPEDLMEFGLIPEFVGRIPLLVELHELDEQALVSVMTEPKDAIIRQFQELFKLDNATLEFTPEALTEIAQVAIKRRTGVRALRAIIEGLLLDHMYGLPKSKKKKYVIDAKQIKKLLAA